MKNKKTVIYDWDDGKSEILRSFLQELVNRMEGTIDYTLMGKALADAWLSLPEGEQYE